MSGRDEERPPLPPDVARVDSAIERAMARGDFENLPGAGKPLELPDVHDPDWWVKQRIAQGDIEPEAMLPVVVLLRREFERREETLVELPTEEAAREYAEEFSARVHDDRRANPFQTLIAPAWDADDAARRWRELRARPAPPVAQPEATAEVEAPRRRWWRFGRRR